MLPGNISLPGDIWFDIAVTLYHPLDVVSLQATCRSLRCALHLKGLWIIVLRAMCSKCGIFYPSFPVEHMTVLQIQNVATGPHRFDKLVRDKSCDIGPEHTTKLDPLRIVSKRRHALSSLELDGLGPASVHHLLFIVPGGRYILVAYLLTGSLKLWDLDVGPTCVAQMTIQPAEHGRLDGHIATQMKSAFAFQVALTTKKRAEGRKVITVHVVEVIFDRNSGRGAELAPVGLPLVLESSRGSGDFFKGDTLLLDGKMLFFKSRHYYWSPHILWNFVEQWWVLGRVTKENARYTIFALDAIVVYGRGRVSVWDVRRFLTDLERRHLCFGAGPHIRSHEYDGRFESPIYTSQSKEATGSLGKVVGPAQWYCNTRYSDQGQLRIIAHHERQSNLNPPSSTLSKWCLDLSRDSRGVLAAEHTLKETYSYPGERLLDVLDHASLGDNIDTPGLVHSSLALGPIVYFSVPNELQSDDEHRGPPWGVYSLPLSPQHDSSNDVSTRRSVRMTKVPGTFIPRRYSTQSSQRYFLGLDGWTGRLLYAGTSELCGDGVKEQEEVEANKYIYIVDFLPC